jgi:hypothetical protein
VIPYELLSGRRAFHGETAVETVRAILKEDPPELPETVPCDAVGASREGAQEPLSIRARVAVCVLWKFQARK